MSEIRLKRIHDEPEDADGARVLVDRVWSRGVKKSEARLDAWLKEVAPSTALRKWFGHDPEKWDQFQARYWDELRDSVDPIAELERRRERGTLTLVYGARDREHNNAVALKAFLERQRSARRKGGDIR